MQHALHRRIRSRFRYVFSTRPLIYWISALVVALLVGGVIQRSLTSTAQAQARWGPSTPVLVAVRDLSPGEPLDATDAELRRLPRAMVAKEALTRLPAGAVVASAIPAGEPVLPSRLGRGRDSPVAALLPAGTRGVALPLPEGLPLHIGDAVDVVATANGDVIAAQSSVIHVDDTTVVVAVPADAVGPVGVAAGISGAMVVLAP
jgi:Flp pilus assembly protein CpaB